MKTERGYNMLNVIFVLHCIEHSGRATEIVHITECAHSWWKASDVNCFHLHDSQRGLTTVTMELGVGYFLVCNILMFCPHSQVARCGTIM